MKEKRGKMRGMTDGLRAAVEGAAKCAEISAAVGEVYAEAQVQIDQRKPRCEMSGRCCRFEEYGHRLYVTTLELAAFVQQLPAVSRRLPVKQDRLPVLATGNGQLTTDSAGCPFQRNRLCTVHPIRPFGCRIFFCDPASTDWQNDAYERFHARLKVLHADLNVPYFYVEWRRALGDLGVTAGVSRGVSGSVSGGETSF